MGFFVLGFFILFCSLQIAKGKEQKCWAFEFFLTIVIVMVVAWFGYFRQGCPAFWCLWAILEEEELYRATHKVHCDT